MPVFGVFGFGNYLIQPVHVRDVARVAIELGAGTEDVTKDVTGPETYRYKEFVKLIAKSMGRRRLIMPIPPIMGWVAGRIMGVFLKDLVITRAEIRGLMQGLMASDEEPLGVISFKEWMEDKGSEVGQKYHNDLKERRYSK